MSLVKKDGLKEKTDEVYLNLKRKFDAFLDHSGAIGRRYRRLDEVGAPLAITVTSGYSTISKVITSPSFSFCKSPLSKTA